jgi:phage/plasmid-like protein (TIGR03299 family)
MAANVETMAYVASEGTPWHGLGTPVEGAMTAAEALDKAGLSWTVRMEGIQTASGIPIQTGRRCNAVVRDDTNQALGVVGRKYRPIQNRDCFDFLDGVAAARGIRYHTAGVLGHGQIVWMLGKLGEIVIPRTDDKIDKFLLFANWHDGTSLAHCFWTPTRVVCQNTLNQALGGASQSDRVSLRHTGNLEGKIAEAQRVLGISIQLYDDFDRQVKASAKVKLSAAQVASYFKSLYPDTKTGEDGASEPTAQVKNTREKLHEIFEGGRDGGIKAIRGTAWKAYNAVTELVDHHTVVKTQKGDDGASLTDPRSAKLASVWFGERAAKKEQAWSAMLELAGIN